MSASRPLRDRLFMDGLFTFAFRLATMALSAILGIITARVLGPHGRGIYALPMVATALVTSAFVGLNSATSYFMLRQDAGRAAFKAGLRTTALFVVLGAPVALGLAFIEKAPWAAVPAILCLTPPAILSVVYGYQISVDAARSNSSFDFANTAVLFVFVLAALAMFGANPMVLIIAWVIASNVFAAIALAWMIRHARRLRSRPIQFWRYVAYSVRVGGLSLVTLLNYRADVYIIAALAGPATLGIYTLGVSAAETLLVTTRVTGTLSSPKIIGITEQREAAEFAARVVRHNILIAGVSCILVGLIAPVLVRLLYGAAFTPVVPAFRVLLVGVFALSLGSPMATFFTVRQAKPQLTLAFAGLSAAICIVVSVATVRHYGMLGAALGSTLGYVIGQSSGIVAFARITRVPISHILLPRWGDILTYVQTGGALLRRLRNAALN